MTDLMHPKLEMFATTRRELDRQACGMTVIQPTTFGEKQLSWIREGRFCTSEKQGDSIIINMILLRIASEGQSGYPLSL